MRCNLFIILQIIMNKLHLKLSTNKDLFDSWQIV